MQVKTWYHKVSAEFGVCRRMFTEILKKEIAGMEIGEVIRTYRKKKGITQEEMAVRLGVSTPAVNKWENGNSMPDILLLAPIARLLGITVDELLSFREELTQEEINGFICDVDEMLRKEPYEKVFEYAKKYLEEYPGCGKLLWQTAVVLNARLLTDEIPDIGKYEEVIREWYVRALTEGDEDTRLAAADSLFGFWLRKEEYEKAESYLTYVSDQNPEKKRKQALIYSKTGRVKEAYRAYEELLFSAYGSLNMVFGGIYQLDAQQGDRQRAHMIVEKWSQTAKALDRGRYHEVFIGLELATEEKDVETTIGIVEEMAANVDDICHYCVSPLYEHMAWKGVREGFLGDIKKTLLSFFRDEKTFGFLKGDKRWQELMEKFEMMTGN